MDKVLIEAIKENNDLSVIAETAGFNLSEFKQKLIKLISESEEFIIEEKKQTHESDKSDSEAYDSDDSDDPFDEIKKSDIEFSQEQIEFMNLAVRERCNLALLAAAGFGKSEVIKATVKMLQRSLKPFSESYIVQHYKDSPILYRNCPLVALTASTGKAASLLQGRTLHSFLGIGLARGSVDSWVQRTSKLKDRTGVFYILRSIKTLIIDEISMISSELLDKVDEYLRKLRLINKPFGDVQMIFVGDFCQLPPIKPSFVFLSKSYKSADVKTIMFTQCFRQSDPAFQNILNDLRFGKCSDEAFKILSSRDSIDPEYLNGLTPMKLLSTNSEVDTINERELQKLNHESKNPIVSYRVKYLSDMKKCQSWMKAEMISESVELCVGAQIMITHNVSPMAVNGTQGIILELLPDEVIVMTHEGNKVSIKYIAFKDPDSTDVFTANSMFQYIPIRLGWAVTIHKSQGTTLSCVEIDLKRVFAHGQSYVAISRVKSLEGLIIRNFSRKAIICDNLVKAFYGIC